MSGVWSWAVQIMLPIPLLFVPLLALPAPRKVKGFIIQICRQILDLPTFGHMKLFHFAIFVATWMFAAQTWGSYQMHQQSWEMRGKEGLSPCEKTQINADKWRHDRNFWISALILMLWVVLNCFYEQSDRFIRLSKQLEEAGIEPALKQSPAIASITETATEVKKSVAGYASAAVPDQFKGTKKQA